MGDSKPRRRVAKAVPPAAPRRSTRKIVVDFPEPLFQETENLAAELSTTRSGFIRLAVEEYIRERRLKMLHQELIEGYTANAQVAREIAEDLARFD